MLQRFTQAVGAEERDHSEEARILLGWACRSHQVTLQYHREQHTLAARSTVRIAAAVGPATP